MVDLSGGMPAPHARSWWRGGRLGSRLGGRLAQGLAPRTAMLISGVLGVLLAVSFWLYEGLFSNVVFTAATTLAIAYVDDHAIAVEVDGHQSAGFTDAQTGAVRRHQDHSVLG